MKKKWEVFVIQHSHIDIGYTHRQEVIEAYHRQFMRQAIAYANSPDQDQRTDKTKFKFTCEGFWAVELFWEEASKSEKEAFIKALKDGTMELSGFYLHLTELLDEGHLRESISYAKEFSTQHEVPLKVAMASDINGFPWTLSQILYDAGIEYLCTNINMHHGGYPLGKPLEPFYWETPKGDKILVWNGLPYHRANILGLMPGYQGDENAGIPGLVLDAEGGYMNVEGIDIAENKLIPFLKGLEASGYPYHMIPLMGSGFYTDNSPATDAYCDLIQQWNKKHGDEITIRTATLEEFFQEFVKNKIDISTYSGDWNDWWSDGSISTPLETTVFRNAQRTKRVVEMLDPKHQIISKEELRAISKKLIQYAEHTWGHSHTREAELIVGQTFLRKSKHAIEADEMASRSLDKVLTHKGETDFNVNKTLDYGETYPATIYTCFNNHVLL